MDLNKINSRLTEIFLYALPFHYLVFVVLLKSVKGLNGWKEGVLALTLIFTIVLLIQSKKITGILSRDIILYLMGIFALIGLIEVVFSPIKTYALYNLRIYLEPFLWYFVFKNAKLDAKSYKRILTVLFYIAIFLSLYGIFQAFVLKFDFLKQIGFTSSDGRFDHVFFLSNMNTFQRVTSTFVYPNTCGFFFAFYLILVLKNIKLIMVKNKLVLYAGIAIISLGLIFTFSRSAWISLFAIALVLLVSKGRSFITKKSIMFAGSGLLLIIIVVTIFHNVSVFKVLLDYMYRTLTMKDSSASGHLQSLIESFNTVKTHVFGTGLGNNGPKAYLHNYNPILTESSYFLIFFETGIFGFIVYFLIYIMILVRSLKNVYRETRFGFNWLTALLTIFVMVEFFFLPHVQDLDSIMLFFAFVGLFNNKEFVVSMNKD